MGTIAKVDINGTEHLIASTAYAVCNTQTGTAAKVATIQGNHVFTLVPGITVHVYFSSSNIAENPTLNINNTGAKPICKHGTTAAPLKFWQAGGVVTFTYSTDPVSTGCWIINNYKEYNTTQENSNWTATTGVTSILNKPAIPSTYSDVGAASVGHTHTYSDVGAASTGHVHGSITSDGKITATGVTLANGDALVVTDSSASHAIKKTSIVFDGSTTTKALTQKGTWETFLQNYTETDPTVSEWAKAPSKPMYTYIEVGAASAAHTHTYSDVGAASAGHTHTAASVGAVPTSRTVNGKSLSSNVTLTAADVGALPTTTVIPAAQVNSDWNATTGVSSILNKPSIPAAQVNANWTATTGVASILNKPSSMTPITHASTATTYGVGDKSNYGHVKLSDSILSTSSAIDGVAATPAAVKAVFDAIQPPQIQLNADWTAASGVSSILNKPAIPSTYSDVGAMSAGGVSIDRKVSTGTNIANITINGATTSLYAPTGGSGDDKVLIVTYSDSTTSAELAAAINAGKTVFCRVDEDPDWNLLPLVYYNIEDDLFYFGGAYYVSNTNWGFYWATWDGGWDDNGLYTPASSGANTWYGTSSTAAATQAKTSTIDNFVLTKGAIIVINFTYANTYPSAKITLNINSTGAKDVYYKNAVTSSANKPLWKANSIVTFVYSGSYYYIVNINPIPNDQLDVGAYNLNYQPQEQSINDYLDNEYHLSVGGALDATMDEFNSRSIIQLGGGTSSTVAATSGTITFVAFDSVMYKRSISGRLSLDSTGGVKVNASGYYRVSAGLYCSCDSRAINSTGGTVNRVRKGLYIYSGTNSATTSCTEYASNIIYSDDPYGMCIGPMIIHANQNDKIYLAFRPMGGSGTYNPGSRTSYLLVEEMPSPYPTS